MFSDYSRPILDIIQSFGLNGHCYADDTQIYVSFTPGEDEESKLCIVQECIEALRAWMAVNKLKLNDDKTEFILLGTSALLNKVRISSIRIGSHDIIPTSSVRNIGVQFDNHLKMDKQITTMCKSAWFSLFTISKIRNFLTEEQTKTLVHAYVTSKLDGFNSLLTNVPPYY